MRRWFNSPLEHLHLSPGGPSNTHGKTFSPGPGRHCQAPADHLNDFAIANCVLPKGLEN